MLAKRLTPILNVSNIEESFEWFEKLGWKKAWDWGDPPEFGGVCSRDCEIFLCQNGQGGRGKGSEFGYVDSHPPPDRAFKRELEAKLDRVRAFMGLES